MSQAVSGPGFLLQYDVGSGSFQTVAEVKDINGPENTLDKVDVTNQQSANNYKEWLATLLDGGQVTFALNLIPSDGTQDSSTGLLFLLQSRLTVDWKVVMGSTGYITTFSGFVDKFAEKFPVANVMSADCSIKITGPVTISAGS